VLENDLIFILIKIKIMKKSELYRLEKSDNAVIVYRIDKNYGRQGVVYADYVRYEYTPYMIPQYIISKCREMLKNYN
jgi:hypothetical protein